MSVVAELTTKGTCCTEALSVIRDFAAAFYKPYVIRGGEQLSMDPLVLKLSSSRSVKIPATRNY